MHCDTKYTLIKVTHLGNTPKICDIISHYTIILSHRRSMLQLREDFCVLHQKSTCRANRAAAPAAFGRAAVRERLVRIRGTWRLRRAGFRRRSGHRAAPDRIRRSLPSCPADAATRWMSAPGYEADLRQTETLPHQRRSSPGARKGVNSEGGVRAPTHGKHSPGRAVS